MLRRVGLGLGDGLYRSDGMETILRRVGGAGPVPGEYIASVWKVLSGLSLAPVRAEPSSTLVWKNSPRTVTASSLYASLPR